MTVNKYENKGKFECYNLKGGILSWLNEGEQVVDCEKEPVKKTHTWGSRWNIAPEEYQTFQFDSLMCYV